MLGRERMVFCSPRRIRSQAYVILLALFLLAQPLSQYGSLNASSSSLAALAASLSALGVSLQSAGSTSWHPTHLFGPGRQLFVSRHQSIATPAKGTDRRLSTEPTTYIARSVYVRPGRSPPILN